MKTHYELFKLGRRILGLLFLCAFIHSAKAQTHNNWITNPNNSDGLLDNNIPSFSTINRYSDMNSCGSTEYPDTYEEQWLYIAAFDQEIDDQTGWLVKESWSDVLNGTYVPESGSTNPKILFLVGENGGDINYLPGKTETVYYYWCIQIHRNASNAWKYLFADGTLLGTDTFSTSDFKDPDFEKVSSVYSYGIKYVHRNSTCTNIKTRVQIENATADPDTALTSWEPCEEGDIIWTPELSIGNMTLDIDFIHEAKTFNVISGWHRDDINNSGYNMVRHENIYEHYVLINNMHGSVTDTKLNATNGAYQDKIMISYEPIANPDFLIGSYELYRDQNLIYSTTDQESVVLFDYQLVPGWEYTYKLECIAYGSGVDKEYTDIGTVQPNGFISGYVLIDGIYGVNGVEITMNYVVDEPTGDHTNTISGTETATTDASGYYKFENVYYAEACNFYLYPSLSGHIFNYDANTKKTVALNLTEKEAECDFEDLTQKKFYVDIKHDYPSLNANNPECLDCNGIELFVPNVTVKLLLNGIVKSQGITNDYGRVALVAGEPGFYTIVAEYEDFSFDGTQDGNGNDILFEMTSTTDFVHVDLTCSTLRSLNIKIAGACDALIFDSAEVRFVPKTQDDFFTLKFVPDIPNTFNVPPYDYYIYVMDQTSPFHDVTNLSFSPDSCELTTGVYDDTLKFIFYDSFSVDFDNFGEMVEWEDDEISKEIRLVKQLQVYPLNMEANWNYTLTNYIDATCPVDTGYISISDDISNRNLVTGEIINGQIYLKGIKNYEDEYPLWPCLPQIYYPYSRNLSISAVSKHATFDTMLTAVVEGRYKFGEEFLLTEPNLPMYVLYDPPGDNSFSTLEKEETVCKNLKYEVDGHSGSLGFDVNIGAGINSLVAVTGPGLTIGNIDEAWGGVDINFDYTFTYLTEEEQLLCISNSEEISTSPIMTGRDANVIVGLGLGIVYADAIHIYYNPDSKSIDKDTVTVVNMNGVNSAYIYSVSEVETAIIPGLRQLMLDYELGAPERIKYANSIADWRLVIDSIDMEHDAIYSDTLISFSGGGTAITKSFTLNDDYNYTRTLQHQVNTGGGSYFDFKIKTVQIKNHIWAKYGYYGEELRKYVNWDTTFHTSYTLMDDDQGDQFTFKVGIDTAYGTPIFKPIAGRSSCPYEGLPFNWRDGPDVTCQSAQTIYNADPYLPVFFDVQMTNTVSILPSIDPYRNFKVRYNGTKPAGVDIWINGILLGGNDYLYTVVPNGVPQYGVVKVQRTNDGYPYSYDYPNLSIIMEPICYILDITTESATMDFGVHFSTPLSPVEILLPDPYQEITSANNNQLNVQIGGYNKNAANFNSIILEYFHYAINDWISIHTFYPSAIGPETIDYVWDVTLIPEGQLKLRAKMNGGMAGYTLSEEVPISIDRNSFQLSAFPIPNDGSWDTEPGISATFTEGLAVDSIDKAKIVVTKTQTGDTINCTLSGTGASLSIVPDDIESLESEHLQVEIDSLMDMYGRLNKDVITWDFMVERKPFKWSPNLVEAEIFQGQGYSFQSALQSTTPYNATVLSITVPDWIESPSYTTTLNGLDSVVVGFTVADTLSIGLHEGMIEAQIDFDGETIPKNILVKLNVLAEPSTQFIPLDMGWELISTYIEADVESCEAVFEDIEDNMSILKDMWGSVYWPYFGVNLIGDIQQEQGYYVRMNAIDTLEIEGYVCNPMDYPIFIEANNWQIISYLRKSEANVVDMVSPIENSIKLVKNGSGEIYYPYFNINTIGNMVPGMGYFINTNYPCALTYPANDAPASKSTIVRKALQHFASPVNTGSNMVVLIQDKAFVEPPKVGDEIAVYSQQGIYAGSSVFESFPIPITVWGNDEFSDTQDGLYAGNELLVKHWKKEENVELEYQIENYEDDEPNYKVNGICRVVSLSAYQEKLVLEQIAPNPFSSSTRILFSVPESGTVQLSVHDVHGNIVEQRDVLVEKGTNCYEFNKKGLSSGSYYLTIQSEHDVVTRKIICIR